MEELSLVNKNIELYNKDNDESSPMQNRFKYQYFFNYIIQHTTKLSKECMNDAPMNTGAIKKQQKRWSFTWLPSVITENSLYRQYFEKEILGINNIKQIVKDREVNNIIHIIKNIYTLFINGENELCESRFLEKFLNTTDKVVFYCYCRLIYFYIEKILLPNTVDNNVKSIQLQHKKCCRNFLLFYSTQYNPTIEEQNAHINFIYVKQHINGVQSTNTYLYGDKITCIEEFYTTQATTQECRTRSGGKSKKRKTPKLRTSAKRKTKRRNI